MNRKLLSWVLYDWANSSFSAIIQTFVFAAYYVQAIAPNSTTGVSDWGFANGCAALCIALISPMLGALADAGGHRKAWIGLFTLLCIVSTALLWFVLPEPAWNLRALVLVSVGIIAAEGSFVFYNAILPDLAKPHEIGKWSGIGWGAGYLGGMVSLILALVLFVENGAAWFALDPSTQEPVRATFLLVAAWYALFALPLFFFIPDTSTRIPNLWSAAKEAGKQLADTWRKIKEYRQILRFLIAKMFFMDGLATLFAFGGVYADSLFGMPQTEIVLFGISMNISAGIGCWTFAYLDDRLGSKQVILFSLGMLILLGSAILMTTNATLFWSLGIAMGLFVGPVQASSRSLMARLAPAHLRNQMFGFYMFSGKATAFAGPFLIGWTTWWTGNDRSGISIIILFFIIGFLGMLAVRTGPRPGK